MWAILLIIWENGSRMKTYGLSRQENNIMKFNFITIVITISCSVCASGDLEIYPDLKFDLPPSSTDENIDDRSIFNDRTSYQRWIPSNFDEYPDTTRKDYIPLIEKLQNLNEFFNRHQFRIATPTDNEEDDDDNNNNNNNDDDDNRFLFNLNPQQFHNTFEQYRNKLEKYNLKHPQILDDVRPYPQEDDFSFGDDVDDNLADDDDVIINKERDIKGKLLDNSEVDTSGNCNGKNCAEASGKGALDDVKFVEDPKLFAYPPSDPRFFQNIETNAEPNPPFNEITDNNKRVKPRNDGKLSNEVITLKQQDTKDDDDDNNAENVAVRPSVQDNESAGVYIIAVVAGISAAATVGLIAVGIGWYNLQKHVKSASDVEYPAYGITGPNKDISPSAGDRRLAQSAQMYHYQHQKQQIIAMESRVAAGDRNGSVSEADSDEENEEGDYTVYECPGLAPTGEMEVKNPLFQDDPTPAQTPPIKTSVDDKK